ncbi:hypothetical protein E4T85_22245, partial [Bacillus stratosphericus]
SVGVASGLSQTMAALGAAALSPASAGLAIATNAGAATMTLGKMINDFDKTGKISLSDAIAVAGNIATIAGAVAVSINPATKLGALAAFGIAAGLEAGYRAFEDYRNFNRDGKYHIVDPLVLDLDGDGIETVGTQGYA